MYTVTYQVLRVLDLPTSQAQNVSWAQSASEQFFMCLVAKQVSKSVCAGSTIWTWNERQKNKGVNPKPLCAGTQVLVLEHQVYTVC